MAKIKARIAKEQEGDEDKFFWGMLEECRVVRRGQHGAFVLSLDEAQLSFTYVLRHGKAYFTSVRIK